MLLHYLIYQDTDYMNMGLHNIVADRYLSGTRKKLYPRFLRETYNGLQKRKQLTYNMRTTNLNKDVFEIVDSLHL